MMTKKAKAKANYEDVKKKSKPGSGSRFKALTESIEASGKSADSAKAIAAAAGRKKYGAKGMSKMANKSK